MNKYIYKNKKTSKKVYSDIKLVDPDLVLVSSVRDTRIKKQDNVIIK